MPKKPTGAGASADRPQITTTAYLILGLLSTREWSAYELAAQIDRGLTEVWPRADRQLYKTPKRLAEQGLVSSRMERTGRRSRTVYSITPSGLRALRKWLATPPAPPSLEFEGMLRVLFAEQGDVEDLRRTLHATIAQARSSRELFESHQRYIEASDGGTFPERRHLFVLSTRFMLGHFKHLESWATWALAQIESWPDTKAPDAD
jgi:PadR family transcriptional regulator, regulatory protein AphA